MLQEKLFKPIETININDALSFAVEKAAVIMEFFETVNIIPTLDFTLETLVAPTDIDMVLGLAAIAFVLAVIAISYSVTMTKKD